MTSKIKRRVCCRCFQRIRIRKDGRLAVHREPTSVMRGPLRRNCWFSDTNGWMSEAIRRQRGIKA